jgi:hypothetical protein
MEGCEMKIRGFTIRGVTRKNIHFIGIFGYDQPLEPSSLPENSRLAAYNCLSPKYKQSN